MIKLTVNESESNQTLEKYVKKVLKEAPLSFIYKLFRKKDIKVNGHWQKEKYIIASGDEISIYITDVQLDEFRKKNITKNSEDVTSYIVYEDENILIINKPRGIVVQEDGVNNSPLSQMVLSYLIEKKEYDPSKDLGYSPAPVHRLDRNTAGLVIFGKNIETLQAFSKIINDKSLIEKRYLTLVKGELKGEKEINAPLFKNSKTGMVSVSTMGKEAITRYKVIDSFNGFSLLEVSLLTGRTHQIRVHMAYNNSPIIGDSKYGDYALNKEIENKYSFKNQFLVAFYIKFHELGGKLKYLSNKSFKIDLPDELNSLLLKLRG